MSSLTQCEPCLQLSVDITQCFHSWCVGLAESVSLVHQA